MHAQCWAGLPTSGHRLGDPVLHALRLLLGDEGPDEGVLPPGVPALQLPDCRGQPLPHLAVVVLHGRKTSHGPSYDPSPGARRWLCWGVWEFW